MYISGIKTIWKEYIKLEIVVPLGKIESSSIMNHPNETMNINHYNYTSI